MELTLLVLQRSRTLEQLDLSHNAVGQEGALALADLVSMSDSITDLRLAWNDIEGDVSTVSSQHTLEAVTADNSN